MNIDADYDAALAAIRTLRTELRHMDVPDLARGDVTLFDMYDRVIATIEAHIIDHRRWVAVEVERTSTDPLYFRSRDDDLGPASTIRGNGP